MDKLMQLYERTKNAKKLMKDAIFEALTRTTVLKFIDDLQRKRLNERGEYYTGEKIKTFASPAGSVYAIYTQIVRKSKGLSINRVTLNFEGDFHRSIKSEIGNGKITPSADFDKPDGNIGDNVKAGEVLGWTDRDIELIAKKIKPIVLNIIRRKLTA